MDAEMTNPVTRIHPEPRTAQQAVVAVMNEVQAVGKNDRNQAQGFNFRGIDAVVNAVGPAFRKHGAFVVPTILSSNNDIVSTSSGKSANVVRLNVQFDIYGEQGIPVSGSVYAESMDHGDKAAAKAMSVALRTFLLQVLCLPTNEPDPDSHSYEITEVAGPSVTELKQKIATFFDGQPKSAITAALTSATGKASGWSADQLAGFLDTLEAAK
jgi:hypothetical protein